METTFCTKFCKKCQKDTSHTCFNEGCILSSCEECFETGRPAREKRKRMLSNLPCEICGTLNKDSMYKNIHVGGHLYRSEHDPSGTVPKYKCYKCFNCAECDQNIDILVQAWKTNMHDDGKVYHLECAKDIKGLSCLPVFIK